MRRSIRPTLAGALLLTAISAAPAAELYVNGAAPAGAETGTKQSPFRTVQAAIDAAGDADTIRVSAGVYGENIRIDGKALILEGAYSAAWVRDLAKNTTTLAGPGGDAVVTLIDSDATIDGFRITGGTGSTEEVPYGYHGGGIYSRGGSPTLWNNLIEDNDVRTGEPPFDYFRGGGVYVSDAPSATIENNVIRGNTAGRGGGVFVVGEAALIRGNTIEDNVAVGDHGGGLFVAVVDARITQNVLRGNEVGRELTYGWGGGLIFVGAGNSAEISFNEVYENFAAAYGSGEFIDEGAQADIHHELIYRNLSKEGCEAVSAIAVDGGEGVGSEATISHCTIAGNVCENAVRGNGLQVEGMSVVSVTNSIFWNNGGDDFSLDNTSTLEVTYTCSQEAIAGVGNIQTDPRFVDEAADDYHLAAGSPCIDAGDPASPFANEPADNGGRADMGRYGNASDSPSPDDDDAGMDDGSDDGAGTDDGTDDGAGTDDSTGADDDADDDSTGNTGDSTGGATDGAGDAGTDDSAGPASATGLCPTASALLFSFSLFGVRRARRPR